jgi:type 1 glutamine amidotransferase
MDHLILKQLPAMNRFLQLALACGALTLVASAADAPAPLRVLYITGGCCHDYDQQKLIIPEGVSARANFVWTVVQEGGTGTKHEGIEQSVYQNPDWAKGYNIVVHNECFADDKDLAYVGNVLAPHRAGTAAVVLHCTMHTFRALETNVFREFLGVTSTHHGPQHPLDVKNLKPENSVMQAFPAVWKTGDEELYAVDHVWPDTLVLATAADKQKDAAGNWVPTTKDNAIIWQHTYGKGRVFGSTLAHNNRTMEDPVFLDLLTRGMLWACDKLDEHGRPKSGYGPPAKK